MNQIEVLRASKRCLEYFESSGLTVTLTTNVVEAAERMEALRTYPASLPLSARYNDFTENSSYWLFLSNSEGDVGGVCAKYEDIGEEPIAHYWARTFNRLFFPDGDGRVTVNGSSNAVRIAGKTVYMGDLFLSEEIRGSSDQLKSLMHLSFVTSIMKWPMLDWVYGFVREPDATRSITYGFTDIIPTVLHWTESRVGRSNREYIVAVPAERLGLVLNGLAPE